MIKKVSPPPSPKRSLTLLLLPHPLLRRLSPARRTHLIRVLSQRDVRTRWERHNEHRVITRSLVTARFSSGYRYHLDGTQRLFLPDGSLFLISNAPSEKGLLRDPILCKDATHQGVRQWYETFTRHATDHGFYVHPIWCFRKDHGGTRGFTVGDDRDDDLPQRLAIPIQNMAQPLFRLLQKDGMFPADSKLNSIVQQCFGDGYAALKQILFASHPVFHDQPSTLIRSYPTQRNYTLHKYHSMFADFLQLRAFISDIDSSFDDTSNIDVFISGTTHQEFLNRCTRDERRSAANAHKYTAAQIVETLETYLMEPDSPTRRPTRQTSPRPSLLRSPRPPYNSSQARSNARVPGRPQDQQRSASLNLLQADSHTSTSGVPDLSTITSDDSAESLESELYTMDVPQTLDARKVHSLYCAAIHQVSVAPPDQDDAVPVCIVCGSRHRFDQCRVLQNTSFLRGHYIRYCQQLRREAASRASSFQGDDGALPSANVSFVDSIPAEDIDQPPGDDDEDAEEEDFQTGRR